MFRARRNSWDQVRQTFAEQFEQNGTNIVYRRSQKGPAIRVTEEERRQFLENFHRNLRRSNWITSLGLTLVLCGILALSLLRGVDVSQAAIFAGISMVIIPYIAYYWWAWSAPARELAGRTPIAGERSPEEVRRLRFQRITYGQLAVAALAGLAIPFVGSSAEEIFSGWNRLWLVFGGVVILLAAVQAFRKWRFEQEDSYSLRLSPAPMPEVAGPTEDPSSPVTAQLWRYVPLALIVLAIPFFAYTPTGKQLANSPKFWPIVMLGIGGWCLLTVVRGYSKGQIEPFARGFYDAYDRETQPKRFWASMAWNTIFGCLCLWLAFTMDRGAAAQSVRDRCYNEKEDYSPTSMLAACNQLLDGKVPLGEMTRADVFLDRGIAYHRLHDLNRAIADDSEAIQLERDYFEAYYNRGLAYEDAGIWGQAIEDYTAAIRLRSKDPDAYFNRGLIFLDSMRLDQAILDFTRAHELDPSSPWPLANRGISYAWKKDRERAEKDFRAVRIIDSSNPVMFRGEAILRMNAGDTRGAVESLTASMKRDPDNLWALRKRAELYWDLGDIEKSREDDSRWRQLNEKPRTPR